MKGTRVWWLVLEEGRGEEGGESHCKNCWLKSCCSYQVTGKKVKGEICVEKEKERGGGVWEGVGEVFRLLASCFAARLRRQPLSRPLFLLPSRCMGGRDGCAGGTGPREENPGQASAEEELGLFFLHSQARWRLGWEGRNQD